MLSREVQLCGLIYGRPKIVVHIVVFVEMRGNRKVELFLDLPNNALFRLPKIPINSVNLTSKRKALKSENEGIHPNSFKYGLLNPA